MDVIREMRRVSKKYVVIIEPNRNNPLNLLFALAVPEERLTIRSSSQFLEDCAFKAKLKIAGLFAHGVIFPNRLPPSWLPLAKKIRKKIPLRIRFSSCCLKILACKPNVTETSLRPDSRRVSGLFVQCFHLF
jgi:hypothetical protein